MVQQAMIDHCAKMQDRFAILDSIRGADPNGGIQAQKATLSSDRGFAAIYYPWITISNPADGSPLLMPPSGHIAGLYARTDNQEGVFKAPANDNLRGVIDLERILTDEEQGPLNDLSINAIRFFSGRGIVVWGARTISSDPEWMYVNVRRLFIYLEHSIDRGTQWAVFEPNNEALWLRIRLTIESFLYDVWRTGALMGTKPQEAYFVRCDRTTMSQGDLDNGRLVCLIGVAPTKPAEFVIFRIGQMPTGGGVEE